MHLLRLLGSADTLTCAAVGLRLGCGEDQDTGWVTLDVWHAHKWRGDVASGVSEDGQSQAIDNRCHRGIPMDETLELVIKMNEATWKRFKDDLKDMAPGEIDWRPLPQANSINAIMKHLRIEAQWYVASLEHGEQSPYQDTASVERLTDSIPLDFEQNLRELEELYTQFIAALRRTTLATLEQQTVLGQVFPGGAPYTADTLSFRQAVHLAIHWGQIRTIRNLYRKTRGEPGRFFPDNPTFPV
jgi:DinB superfamily